MKPRIPPHFMQPHNGCPLRQQVSSSKDAELVCAGAARNEKADHPRANKARKAAPENKSTDPA